METLRVLVVDDELGMRMGVARALRDHTVRVPDISDEFGLTVEQAESGEQALEMIEANPPDLMLLDHKLPGMSGTDVLQAVSEKHHRILSVMITAYASLDTAITAIKRGAFDFLAKPFTPDELKAVVDKAAENLILAREARKLVRERRQARFEFISVLAHELKAPLGAVEGYLTTIRDRAAGDDQGVYDHMVERCLIRMEGMRKMIMDLLDLTRIESGRKKRELTTVNLADSANTSIETFSKDAADRNITVELHAEPDVTLTADAGEMEIILNNLVSNAVKYNRDGGRVAVTLTRDNGLITLGVADTGIGMAQEEAARLFSDFVRIKNAKTRNILGSGLGLAIVKKLANTYGGTATVQSEPDVGTAFTITLGRDGPTQDDDDPQ